MAGFWSFFSGSAKGKKDNRCLGIEMHNSQAFAVLADRSGVRLCYTPKTGERGLAGLEQWLLDNDLQNLPVVISLDSLDYELHLLEAPAVEPDELSDALRFRIRDIISRPLNEVVVQGFPLPADAYRGRMDMAFTVVVEREVIQKVVSWCRRQELQLELITVPELSLLNLLAEYGPEGSVGVLRLDAEGGMIYLYREGALYIARRLHLGVEALRNFQAMGPGDMTLASEGQVAALALELQRSLDFFDSQQGMGLVSEIWVLKPDEADISAVLPQLESSTNVRVRDFVLPHSSPQIQGDVLTASLATAYGSILASGRQIERAEMAQ